MTTGLAGWTSCAVLSLDFGSKSPSQMFTLALSITHQFDESSQERVAFGQHKNFSTCIRANKAFCNRCLTWETITSVNNLLSTKSKSHLLIFDRERACGVYWTVWRTSRLVLVRVTCVFVLTQKKKKKTATDSSSSNSPDDVMRSWSVRNADPGVDDQSREENTSKSRRLEERDADMMLERNSGLH